MTITLLWTDVMVWLLVAALAVWGWILSRSPQIRKQWHSIFKSGIAMASAIVLLFYLFFALLDSVHMRFTVETHPGGEETSKSIHYEGDMVSLLDLLFQHTLSHTERTYSAPFATHEYAKSIVVDKNNVSRQVYLPLKYVHVPKGESTAGDIVKKSLFALFAGLLVSLLLVAVHLALKGRGTFVSKLNALRRGETALPWRTAYVTFTLLLMTFVWMYLLSYHYHVLGTDKVGGDVFYQSVKSIRTGVLIGILTTLVMLPVSITLGISAGFFGGRIDDVIQYIYTTLNSIPGVLLIAGAVLVTQVMMDNHPQWFETTLERSDLRLLFLILILGMTSWTGLCRLLRAETLKISRVEFVTAARAFGVSKWKIIFRHIMPNLMHIILISVVLDFSALVLAEAVLSYVGVGVDPTMYSWGNMINQARLEMAREPMVWWSLFSAFIFMFILVLAANLFSDRVQTVLDPRNAE
ncbi:Oligopeptide transport system permease protein [hydrothermal vent metagenome]|uniref:Oligopeptide transport system permease protein n=1 Tax=hydrothermal vent metagenome TaxID=652676 RepID=A0A1W1CQ17_9ZZZZ